MLSFFHTFFSHFLNPRTWMEHLVSSAGIRSNFSKSEPFKTQVLFIADTSSIFLADGLSERREKGREVVSWFCLIRRYTFPEWWQHSIFVCFFTEHERFFPIDFILIILIDCAVENLSQVVWPDRHLGDLGPAQSSRWRLWGRCRLGGWGHRPPARPCGSLT